MSSKATNNWLKKIFSVGTLSLIVAVIGTYISYKTLLADTGGELDIMYNSKYNNSGTNVDVFLDSGNDVAEKINELLPEFSNPSKYMLKDFYLRYNFKGNGFELNPSGYFDKIEGNKSVSLTYRPGRLAAGMKVEDAVTSLVVKDDAQIVVEIDASFNGNSAPYHRIYNINLRKGHVAHEDKTPVADHPKVADRSKIDEAQPVAETKAVRSETIKKTDNESSAFDIILYFFLYLFGFGLVIICSIAFTDLENAFKKSGNRTLSNLRYMFFSESSLINDPYPQGWKLVWANFYWICGLLAFAFILLFILMIISLIIYLVYCAFK